MKKSLLCIPILLFMLLFTSISYAESENSFGIGSGMNNFSDLNDVTTTNTDTIKNLKIEEVLGPLAPLATSPFFGLTLTSGASILAEKDIIKNNEFLKTNKLLANYFVFTVLLILTIGTSIPNLSKISKSAGIVFTQIEEIAGPLICTIMLLIAFSPQATSQAPIMYKAGFIEVTYTTLIIAIAAINLFVIQYVRAFLELMILISPIPFVDAIFETAKKSLTAGLFAIYLFSPVIAFTINIIILAISLLVFAKANRMRKYFLYLYLEPKLKFIFRKKPVLVSKEILHKYKSAQLYESEPKLLFPVYPINKVGQIKAKDKSWLAMNSTGLYLYKFPLFRKPVVENLNKYGQLKIASGLTQIRIFNDENEQERLTLVINNHYKSLYDEIARTSSFIDEKSIGLKKLLNNSKEKIGGKVSFFDKAKQKLIPQSEVFE